MWTPKRAVKNWLGISDLEEAVNVLFEERTIDALLEQAEVLDAEEAPIKKGYNASP